MVWPFGEQHLTRDPWRELRQLQTDMERLFGRYAPERGAAAFPAVNMWGNTETVVITAEVAGIEPDDLDITVQDDQLTIRGTRNAFECGAGEVFHRRERGCGEFARSISLPFAVETDKVEATYKLGVLTITVQRAETDKPKKISIKTS